MNTASIPLSRYLSAPASAVELTWFPPESAACFAPFFSRWRGVGLLKWSAVTAVRDALLQQRCLESFSVHLHWSLKSVAYMNDAGRVYLSLGLLAASSALSVLSVYCHELSHIKLSQRADYPAIKALQREFKQRFKEHKLCELLSPIEYYAMLISRSLLADIADHTENAAQKEKLRPLQEDLEEKIRFLEQELSKLAEHNVT